MYSPQAPPSRSWSAAPQGLSSTPRQTYTTGMFGSSQGYPRHNPSPLSDTPDNQVVTPIQALTNRVVYLEQQSLAPQMRRIAEKNARNSVIRVFMDPGSPSTLGTNSILDKCQRASHPFNLVIAVQRPLLAPEGEVLLIVRSDEDAEQIRSNKGQLSEIFGVASYFCPERFYITPSVFTKDDLVRMSTGEGAKHDYCELFKNPHEQLTAWRNETGLDIKKADWRHGYLWLLLNSIDEAREAVSGKVYSLGGFQTQFISRDPRSLPMQCFNCQHLGHMSNRCRRKVPCCGYCALEHRTDQCTTEPMAKKCVICQGPHASYRLRECRHPLVRDALEKCKLWRGPAPWDKLAASRIQSSLFEGEHTDTALADLPGNDTFPSHVGDWGDALIDESYNTAYPWPPTFSPGRSFSPMECHTTSLVPGTRPHISGNTTVPSFNPAPGTSVLLNPAPPSSVTSSASRASLAECLEILPRSSSGHRASREILREAIAQISCAADRAPSPSNSEFNLGSTFDSAELDMDPDNHLETSTELDLDSDNHLEISAGLGSESKDHLDTSSATDSAASDNHDTSLMAGSTELDLASDNHLETSSMTDSILSSPPHPVPDSATPVDSRNTTEPKLTPSPSPSGPGSNSGLTAGSDKLELASDNRLDTPLTAGSTLSSPPRSAPDSATQGDSRNTVEPKFTFVCFAHDNSSPAARVASQIPAKRPAGQDEHSSVRHAAKRVRRERDVLIPEPLVLDEVMEEATRSDKNLGKVQSYALDKNSGVEDANSYSEGNTRREDCHSDEPMAGQTEDRGAHFVPPETVLYPETSPERRNSPSSSSAIMGKDASMPPPPPQTASHNTDAKGLGKTLAFETVPADNSRGSLVFVEETSRGSPSKTQQPDTSHSATQGTTQLGNRPGSLIPGDAAPGYSPAEALSNAAPTRSSIRMTRSSMSRAQAAAIPLQTPRHTKTSAENISSDTSFISTTDGSQRAGNSWTTPETDTSSPTRTPATALSPSPTFRLTGGYADEGSLPTPPVPQSDEHELESSDESDPGDVIQDCIIARGPAGQTSLHAFFTPKPKSGVE